MLRPALLLLLLAASGARSQPLAERVVGDWANADTVAYPTYTEDGTEIVDANGDAAFHILYMHLSLTDSTYTSTTVFSDNGEVRGSESTWAYSVRDGQVVSANDPPIGVRVDGDSLILSRDDSLGVPQPYVYVRTAPLRPPEALLGDWISEPLTDNAGVVFDLPFRFHADGTMLVGASEEPLAYRAIGPYLLMYDTEYAMPDRGVVTQLFRVAKLDEQGDRITLTGLDEDTLVLHRRQ